VRELENVVSRGILRAAARATGGDVVIVDAGDLEAGLPNDDVEPQRSTRPPQKRTESPLRPLRDAVADHQRELIRVAVARNDGNWSAAARDLGLDRGNLHHLAKRLGIK
jgi:anaerobic nitric oxide reductase transcription regulator